jgi:hypothetical protein
MAHSVDSSLDLRSAGARGYMTLRTSRRMCQKPGHVDSLTTVQRETNSSPNPRVLRSALGIGES